MGFPDHVFLDLAGGGSVVVEDLEGGFVPGFVAVLVESVEEIDFVKEDREIFIKGFLGVGGFG